MPEIAILVSKKVKLAHALLKSRYAARDLTASDWDRIHPSAVIHDSATVPDSVSIEPHVVIGKNVVIGERSRIMAGSVIEHDVTIGSGTVVHPNVVIGYGCRIGSEVVIHSGSVIGSEGYGFAQDARGKSHRIPQTGIVVIEDRVQVGAGNCIDRATYHETCIGAGTKLDNLVHIAHNVEIGEDCLLTSMLCIAGSSRIGSRVVASGQTGILDHVSICDDVVLLHHAGVTKDIKQPGAYAGTPVQPLSDYKRSIVLQRTIGDLRKRLQAIEKWIFSDRGSGTTRIF